MSPALKLQNLRVGYSGGVEALAYDVHIDLTSVRLRKRLPVRI